MDRQRRTEHRDCDSSAGADIPRKYSTDSGVDPASRLSGRHLAVEHRALADLIPYARNARTHSDAQVAEIAASIRAFGWTNPILVDGENGIIAGHGRLMAARKLKLGTVPVIEVSGLSEAEKRAYLLADNKLALNAGWDAEMLALEIGDLGALGFDLSLTGFSDEELAGLAVSRTMADPVARRMAGMVTAPRSRSNACAGRSSTTPRRARRSTTPSWAPAPP